MDVVRDLGQNASPIDAVDSSETKCLVDLGFGEECLEDVLQGDESVYATSMPCRSRPTWQSSNVPSTAML